VDAQALAGWIAAAGLDKVLNRAGTTFRKLPEAERADLDGPRAIALMVANPLASSAHCGASRRAAGGLQTARMGGRFRMIDPAIFPVLEWVAAGWAWPISRC
jgi:hypothetical protein